MIVCPSCKEEIEDDSHFCDQCGQELVYCSSCGRVGMGRRCTYCGGLMISADEMIQKRQESKDSSVSNSTSARMSYPQMSQPEPAGQPVRTQNGVPTLTLYNPSLDIRLVGMNGAIIGRRQGPYAQQLESHMYISGVHAQLIYKPDSGWCIIDKHSSNGTKLNQRDIQPDIPMSIKSGDIVTLANVNLQVTVN
ncbi:MAG: FHA domain-containing protein [Prevotella sp.]|nr:FHA domain-containing protein [Prevotella sp.]